MTAAVSLAAWAAAVAVYLWAVHRRRTRPTHQCTLPPIEPGPSVLALWEAQVVAEATDIARTEATR